MALAVLLDQVALAVSFICACLSVAAMAVRSRDTYVEYVRNVELRAVEVGRGRRRPEERNNITDVGRDRNSYRANVNENRYHYGADAY